RPFSPCRNTASFPETPCASSAVDSAHTRRNASAATCDLPPTATCPLRPATLFTGIPHMAVVARVVEISAGLDDLVFVLRFGRLHCGRPLLHHVARHLHPVALVDGATAEQQVARLDD